MQITAKTFGMFQNQEVTEYTLTNTNGVSLSAITYGAIVTKIMTPDKNGQIADITLNVESLEDMVAHRPFYGAAIGRVAGRITDGQFELDGQSYQLDVNEKGNQLHGGPSGLDTKLWSAETKSEDDAASILFTLTSLEGENGYPGNLEVQVEYRLTEKNEWIIQYTAKTDKPTLFNPTNHIYFNLTGDIKQPILDHTLQLASTKYGTLADRNLPTGKLEDSKGTAFDFSEPKRLREAVLSDDSQIKPASGLDHPFVLDQKDQPVQAILSEINSGRRVTMTTNEESVVIFTHNKVMDAYTIKGEPAQPYAGLTLETQALPDAINHPGFGNIELRPEETYHSQTTYRFDTI
ncbi:aldose epimerase family protein [Marinilactibacillus piezotolerans]|uniref:aldose epimerase family protein n=1 Tax=Marinilactibacillus piezotolerans TaxID=258723 RepID=UPI0009AFFE35|nr:aldose epimerase family protein [Marinilactibacillus piezotolerans]